VVLLKEKFLWLLNSYRDIFDLSDQDEISSYPQEFFYLRDYVVVLMSFDVVGLRFIFRREGRFIL
jgi:hypothetical protein